jgi:hypothetical protein
MLDEPDFPARQRPVAVTVPLAGQPASFWLAALACVAVIVGAVGPWMSAFGFPSISGTSLHGGREVAVGAVGLAMLALHGLRGYRLPLVVASLAGAIGAIGAASGLHQISRDGAVDVLGYTYRYLHPSWGLYLVLAGGIVLACAASILSWGTWRSSRKTH